MSAQEIVDKAIAEHDVVIFSKSYCPYCKKAKVIINGLDLPKESVEILELDEIDNGSEIQDYLEQKTKQRTVPNIWIKQQFIGGSSDLAAIPTDELEKKVKA